MFTTQHWRIIPFGLKKHEFVSSLGFFVGRFIGMLPDSGIHQSWTFAPACASRFIGVLFTDLVCIFQLLFVESSSPSCLLKLGEEKHLPGRSFFPSLHSRCCGKEVSTAVSLANSCLSSYRFVLQQLKLAQSLTFSCSRAEQSEYQQWNGLTVLFSVCCCCLSGLWAAAT